MSLNKSECAKLRIEKATLYANNAKQKRVNQYLNNPTKCLKCDSILNYEKRKYKFCSRTCGISYNNSISPKIKRKIELCLNCNAVLSWKKNKFCNRSCHGQYRFLNGDISEPKTLKKYIIKKQGNFCIKCNNNGFHNGERLILELDHIDGNSDNNFPQNVRLLCPNCHSQCETSCGGARQKKFHKRNLIMHKRSVKKVIAYAD